VLVALLGKRFQKVKKKKKKDVYDLMETEKQWINVWISTALNTL
jgi:hypothetical protein